VTVTNNAGADTYTFTANGTFTFQFADAAGNTGTATATVANIDKTPPTATVDYSTTAPTNGDVIATLNPDETVTVTNNAGADTYTFTANGTFTFQFADAAGNTGTATATVANIDKIPPLVSVHKLITADTTPLITGTTDKPELTELEVVVTNGSQTQTFRKSTGTVTIVGNEWSAGISAGAALSVGVYSVNVTATDAGGNVGTDDTSNEIVIVSSSPSADLYRTLVLPLAGIGNASRAFGINNGGTVVGSIQPFSGAFTPAVWDNGAGAIDSDRPAGTAYGLNDSGLVVGSIRDPDGPGFVGFVWDINNGTSDLLGIAGAFTTRAWDINDGTRGGQIVGSVLYTGGQQAGVRWNLPSAIAETDTRAIYAINSTGWFAGEYRRSTLWVNHAFAVPPGTGQSLIDLDPNSGAESRALAVSEPGDGGGVFVAGEKSDELGVTRAFFWRSDTQVFQELGTLGGLRAGACGVNSDGVVVGWSETADGAIHAALWINQGIFDLSGVLPQAARATNVLERATAINDSGQIAGYGTIDGQTRAVRLDPLGIPTTGTTHTFNLQLRTGWNLISLPIQPTSQAPLWAAISSTVWDWNGTGYEIVTQAQGLTPKRGYWVYRPGAATVVAINGTPVPGPGTLDVEAGWSLIGPVGTAPYADVEAPGATPVWITPANGAGVLFGWDGVKYGVEDELSCGHGHWLDAKQAGTIKVGP